MFCPKCGSQQPDNAKFCGVCGYQFNPTNTASSRPGGVAGTTPTPKPYVGQNFASSIPVPNAVKNYGALIALVIAGIVLAIALLAPTVTSPLYSTSRAVARDQGADVSDTPTSIEFGLIDFAGIASGINSLSSLASMTGGSSSITDSFEDIAGSLDFVKVILIAWILVAVLIGVCICTYKTNPGQLGKVLLITLAVEFILCIIWFFVVGAASSGLADMFGGQDAINEAAKASDIKGDLSALGVSLWGWLATILSLAGGVVAFLNSRN